MKILVVSNGELVWRDAKITTSGYAAKTRTYSEADIHAVAGMKKNAVLKCTNCGEIVKNTETEIQKHLNKKNELKTCFTCSYVCTCQSDTEEKSDYILTKDNRFLKKTERTCDLKCRFAKYPWRNILEEHEVCRYASCSRDTLQPYSDFWTRNPHAFSDAITIDRVLPERKSIRLGSDAVYVTLKGKYNLTAVCVSGIVTCFIVKPHKKEVTLAYDQRSDSLFIIRTGRYVAADVYWCDETNGTMEELAYIRDKIEKLYRKDGTKQ